MPLTTATKEAIAVYFGTLGDYISLHTADPGSTGTSEATGGSYARQQTTWAAGGSDGVITGSEVTFASIPAGTYTHAGVWSAASGGTFRGSATLSSVTLSTTGDVRVTPTFTES